MKHFAIFTLIALVAASLAFASKPPANLATDPVTGGEGPVVQSLGSSSGAQPVDIMNWLIDENGNLRVSPQVRDEMHWFLPEGSEVHLARGETWHSEWVDARRFNVVRIDFMASLCTRSYVTSWAENHEAGKNLEYAYEYGPFTDHKVAGPRVALACTCENYDDCVIWRAAMYLRAE